MSVVGVLGGGQLGRMLALSGIPLGIHVVVLDGTDTPPAHGLATHLRGDFRDPDALERFWRSCDAITYESELVPIEAVRALSAHRPVFPPPRALEIGQDRLLEKRFFAELGIPTAPFAPVDRRDQLDDALDAIGYPAILKTRRGGYDGRGQVVIRERGDVDDAWESLRGQALLLEGWVDFARELSVIGVRGSNHATVTYPLVQNVHQEGILRRSVAPAPNAAPDLVERAGAIVTRALDALGYVGVLTVELFERDGRLWVNEMAPRVHNSGHWTIEGAETSQFENHLRAGLGLPLGITTTVGCSAMVNLIGAVPDLIDVAVVPGAHLHLYGKRPAPGRKLGHVTLRAHTADARDLWLSRLTALIASRSGVSTSEKDTHPHA